MLKEKTRQNTTVATKPTVKTQQTSPWLLLGLLAGGLGAATLLINDETDIGPNPLENKREKLDNYFWAKITKWSQDKVIYTVETAHGSIDSTIVVTKRDGKLHYDIKWSYGTVQNSTTDFGSTSYYHSLKVKLLALIQDTLPHTLKE